MFGICSVTNGVLRPVYVSCYKSHFLLPSNPGHLGHWRALDSDYTCSIIRLHSTVLVQKKIFLCINHIYMISQEFDEEFLLFVFQCVGTPYYMSPELIRGERYESFYTGFAAKNQTPNLTDAFSPSTSYNYIKVFLKITPMKIP